MLQLIDVTYSCDWLGMFDFLFFCRGRWLAKLVAPACHGSSLGSNPDISKIQNGRHKQRDGQHRKIPVSVYRRLDFSIVDLCIMSAVACLITPWCSTVRDETTVAVSGLLGPCRSE